jgi:glutathione S-transferase
MNIVLYYAPTTCALAPYVTLTEANASFEVRPLNFRKQQHMAADYMTLNPRHKVPMLVVDGRTLTENVAIHQWIARGFPQARLMPADPWQELQAVSLMSWFASGIHPYLSRINNPAKVRDVAGTAESVRRFAADSLYEAFGIAEAQLAGRDWFFDHFTAPDAHFFWCFRRATQFDLELARFRNCQAHFERMQGRPSVQKVLTFEKSVLDSFARAA